MKSFRMVPQLRFLASVRELCKTYAIGAGDLVFVSASQQARNFAGVFKGAIVIDYRQYGSGEPTDLMVEGICQEIGPRQFQRVLAIGGGTILDVAKLFALKNILPVDQLFAGKIPAVKDKTLILLPTTCGTGSEMTNISILELTRSKTKLGLAADALYADEAVLLPELLAGLPFPVFAASSLDALIHAVESYTSPKATPLSQLFSLQALTLIVKGYQEIAAKGEAARELLLGDFLLASTYAGLAFGNAGCAAVHAMSYPLGAARHVPHGEANYAMFSEVYKTYKGLGGDGSLTALERHLAAMLVCQEEQAFAMLDDLLQRILPQKKLREYGVRQADLQEYADIVMTRQGRLMANNYAELSRDAVLNIYEKLF